MGGGCGPRDRPGLRQEGRCDAFLRCEVRLQLCSVVPRVVPGYFGSHTALGGVESIYGRPGYDIAIYPSPISHLPSLYDQAPPSCCAKDALSVWLSVSLSLTGHYRSVLYPPSTRSPPWISTARAGPLQVLPRPPSAAPPHHRLHHRALCPAAYRATHPLRERYLPWHSALPAVLVPIALLWLPCSRIPYLVDAPFQGSLSTSLPVPFFPFPLALGIPSTVAIRQGDGKGEKKRGRRGGHRGGKEKGRGGDRRGREALSKEACSVVAVHLLPQA